jgi:hypothetical protein
MQFIKATKVRFLGFISLSIAKVPRELRKLHSDTRWKALNRRSRAYLKVNFLKKRSGNESPSWSVPSEAVGTSSRSSAGIRNVLLLPKILETEEQSAVASLWRALVVRHLEVTELAAI